MFAEKGGKISPSSNLYVRSSIRIYVFLFEWIIPSVLFFQKEGIDKWLYPYESNIRINVRTYLQFIVDNVYQIWTKDKLYF